MVKPIRLPPSARRNRGETALQRLRRDLLTGRYQPGERLPPERELASRFGTNRNTLREVLRTLESENLVRARQGDGTIVLDWRSGGEITLLQSFLTEETPAGERLDAVTTLLELRTTLLDQALALAARRGNGEDWLAIESALETLRAMPFGPRAVEADIELWRALVRASHNLVLIWVFNTFARIFVELGRRFPMLWRTDAEYTRALGELIDAVRADHVERARSLMRRLFDERTADVMRMLHGAGDSRKLREWLAGAGEAGDDIDRSIDRDERSRDERARMSHSRGEPTNGRAETRDGRASSRVDVGADGRPSRGRGETARAKSPRSDGETARAKSPRSDGETARAKSPRSDGETARAKSPRSESRSRSRRREQR